MVITESGPGLLRTRLLACIEFRVTTAWVLVFVDLTADI